MTLPKEIQEILNKLEKAGFEAYVVGGCVRDLLFGKKPKDWDITTNAKPEEIQKIFPNSFYENKLIRAVGNPEERFDQDALRLLRAIRFSLQLDFEIDGKTFQAIKEKAGLIQMIAKERVREEVLKIIQHAPWPGKNERSNEVTEEELKRGPARAFELMREAGLLKHILPEFEDGFGVGQNKHHVFSVWEHNLRAFTYAVKENFNLHVRLGALFHDIAKPHTKKGDGPNSTFYGHDVVGAKITAKIMTRLKFSKKDIEKVVLLVRYHLFQSDT